MRNTGSIANATPVDDQVNHLATNLKYAAAILVLAKEDARFAPVVLTLRALRAVGLLACLDHRRALTVGTLNRDRDHRHPPRPVIS